MTTELIDLPTMRLAQRIIDDIFVNVVGQRADSVVLTSKDGLNLGGWGETPLRLRIARLLREDKERIDRRDPNATPSGLLRPPIDDDERPRYARIVFDTPPGIERLEELYREGWELITLLKVTTSEHVFGYFIRRDRSSTDD